MNFFPSKSFAIDLGNNNTLLTSEDKILFSEPSYVVFDVAHGSVKAVGEEAFRMFEKTHGDLKPVKPLRGGVIADYESATAMISGMLRKSNINRRFYERFDSIISGVPYATTDVEQRALTDALQQFNPARLSLVYEPIAAAIGMGLNVSEPDGKMVVDIGGGITEIVILSLSGVASFSSLKTSGDSMDSDIRDYFNRKYNLVIGLKTAEQIKIKVGAVSHDLNDAPEPILVKGNDIARGVPGSRRVGHSEIADVLDKSISTIEDGIIATLEKCPAELASDIFVNGIYLTGGNALLRGLPERLNRRLGLPVVVDPEPLLSVTKGIGHILKHQDKYRCVLVR